MYGDFQSAIAGMTRIRDSFEPVPENRDIYRDLYNKVYRRMYGKLKDLYGQIRDITGYPPRMKN